MDEAQYLLDNADVIPDPDERLRRDLRHLGCYAVDREGAAEVGMMEYTMQYVCGL
jgi:hypothetical protein